MLIFPHIMQNQTCCKNLLPRGSSWSLLCVTTIGSAPPTRSGASSSATAARGPSSSTGARWWRIPAGPSSTGTCCRCEPTTTMMKTPSELLCTTGPDTNEGAKAHVYIVCTESHTWHLSTKRDRDLPRTPALPRTPDPYYTYYTLLLLYYITYVLLVCIQ